MITIPSLGNLALGISAPPSVSDPPVRSASFRNGSVLEVLLGSRDHSNRESREGSMGPPSRQSSNASTSSITLTQDGASACQFFEVLYLGKITSSGQHKARPTCIDDALEKFRAHNNQLEEQKVRQSSLPAPINGSLSLPVAKLHRHVSHVTDEAGHGHAEMRHLFTSKLGTQEEEEPTDGQQVQNQSVNSSVFKNTEQALKNLSNRLESKLALTEAREKEIGHSKAGSPGMIASTRVRTSSGGGLTLPSNNQAEILMRARASSMGSAARPRRVNSGSVLDVPKTTNTTEHNRTMLLQISRCDVKLVSPDRKSVLLSKPFCDISDCAQGVQNPDHFGFICRDATSENHVCFVFKCQSASVADEIMTVLRLACQFAAESQQRRLTNNQCEHCPSVWLQRLLIDIEGLPEHKVHSVLMKRIHTLPEADQEQLIAKYRGADLIKVGEQNDLLLLLLKAYCESRQMTHTHDTAENRHEFLSQYFEQRSGVFFQKAKRSLSNSFDQLLRRKTKDEMGSGQLSMEEHSPERRLSHHETTPPYQPHHLRFDIADTISQSPLAEKPQSADAMRPRSSTLCSSHRETIKKELKEIENKRKISQPEPKIERVMSINSKSPIMDLFLKVGSPPPTSPPPPPPPPPSHQPETNIDRALTPRKLSSANWRQAIFQQVQSPNQNNANEFSIGGGGSGGDVRKHGGPAEGEHHKQRTSQDYRALWRKAIQQQILLIRMEKENKRLKAHQEEMAIKRMKLSYDEIAPCPRPVARSWEKVLTSSPSAEPCDYATLVGLLERGVSKQRRGEIWRLMINARDTMEMEQPSWCRRVYDDYSPNRVIDYDKFPLQDVPYDELLAQLTSHQHAIIIDLSRTFPTLKYFEASLGPGQLALYNLLKAYSLLDSQVGYCQGLSFIAGVLLLHLSENEAFCMLRYLMFELGLRHQYLPDMAALHVQLYQMARLLRDQHRDLYEHLEENDISPTLYAAPWFLTLFASQFPLGFVVRVFDLIFMSGLPMVFRVALSLLADHKDMLMQCRNFEQLMDYFKTTLPLMGSSQLERVVKGALELDISRQLAAYEVEYHVLQEEIGGMSASLGSPHQQHAIADNWMDKAQRFEESNRELQREVRELQAELQAAKVTARVLETNLSASQCKCSRLERELRSLESNQTLLIQLVTQLMQRLPKGEEIVIPPDLVCFLEGYNATLHTGGISITVTHTPPSESTTS